MSRKNLICEIVSNFIKKTCYIIQKYPHLLYNCTFDDFLFFYKYEVKDVRRNGQKNIKGIE